MTKKVIFQFEGSAYAQEDVLKFNRAKCEELYQTDRDNVVMFDMTYMTVEKLLNDGNIDVDNCFFRVFLDDVQEEQENNQENKPAYVQPKTQEELHQKLYTELMDKYGNDEDCVNDIEESLNNKDYEDLFSSYDIDGVRLCSECGKLMDEGYCIGGGMEYYCSDECLHKNMSQEEYDEAYDEEDSDTYWTAWEY